MILYLMAFLILKRLAIPCFISYKICLTQIYYMFFFVVLVIFFMNKRVFSWLLNILLVPDVILLSVTPTLGVLWSGDIHFINCYIQEVIN